MGEIPLYIMLCSDSVVQPDENFYTCTWSYDSETYESLLVIAGFKGIIRVIGTSTVNCKAVSCLIAHPIGIVTVLIFAFVLSVLFGSWKLHQ